jgi:phospholipid transport system substrate-binding protein
MRLRALALLPLFFALPAPSVLAQAPAAPVAPATAQSAQAFIKDLSDRAFAVLRDPKLDQTQREQRFRTMLREGFALDLISDAVLGLNRRTATPTQLSAFNAAFPDYIVRTFTCPLMDNRDATVRVDGTTPVGSRGDVLVKTTVTGPRLSSPVKADWRVRTVPGRGLRIIDLSVEGVSLGVTQRDAFNAKIQKSGFDAVINDVRTADTNCKPAPRSSGARR